jgi:hypothetical protein
VIHVVQAPLALRVPDLALLSVMGSMETTTGLTSSNNTELGDSMELWKRGMKKRVRMKMSSLSSLLPLLMQPGRENQLNQLEGLHPILPR